MTTEVLTPAGIYEPVTAAQAAGLCGVDAQTIRKWHTRGYLLADGTRHRLPCSGLDEHGHKLFILLDIAKAERATHIRARRDLNRGKMYQHN